jgi:mRNA interferase MazF
MPIQFPVPPGTLLLCDYNTGFMVPEMVKRRPAIVLSPRLPHRNNLCTVAPLSTTAPEREVEYVCKITPLMALPRPWDAPEMWVKADMLATVCFSRSDLFRADGRDREGKRIFLKPRLPSEDMARVRHCVLRALGMGLTEPGSGVTY